MSTDTQNSAPVSAESVVTLNGAQLLQALDFIAPDRDTDPQQLECELTISFADGPAGGGYYCYCTDYPDEGAIMLDAETADDLISADSDTALTQQTLDDVKAGIPARDAEIDALRKEIEALQAAQAQQPVSGADGLLASPTQGMTLGQRIAHVGGRENAQGYVEFGSPMAVNALIQHVLRDFHRQGRVNLAPAQKDADKVDAEPDMFWDADNPEQCQDSIHNLLVEVQCDRTLRVGDIVEIQQAMSLPNISVRVAAVDTDDDDGDLKYEIVNESTIDAARKENSNA